MTRTAFRAAPGCVARQVVPTDSTCLGATVPAQQMIEIDRIIQPIKFVLRRHRSSQRCPLAVREGSKQQQHHCPHHHREASVKHVVMVAIGPPFPTDHHFGPVGTDHAQRKRVNGLEPSTFSLEG